MGFGFTSAPGANERETCLFQPWPYRLCRLRPVAAYPATAIDQAMLEA